MRRAAPGGVKTSSGPSLPRGREACPFASFGKEAKGQARDWRGDEKSPAEGRAGVRE